MTIRKGISDEQVIELHKQGLNDAEIARKLQCTPSNIYSRRKKLKLAANVKTCSGEEVKELYEQGLDDTKIAIKLGYSVDTIRYWRYKLNLKRYRIKNIDRESVKLLYDQGLSDSEIARKLGCSNSTIGAIRNELNLQPHIRRKLKISIDEMMELWEKGFNDREISEKAGCSPTAIRKRRNKLGLKSKWDINSKRKFTNEQLREDIDNGLTDKQISKKHKCSPVAVFLRRKKLKILINSVYLTDQDLLDAYNSGKFGTDKELARHLRYTDVTIRNRRHKLGLKPLSARGRRQSGEPVEKAIVTVTEKTREDLKKLKKQGETYTDVVEKLVEEVTRDESD